MDNFGVIYKRVVQQWMKSEPVLKISQIADILQGRPFILYGAGRLAGVFIDVCRELKLSISGICDQKVRGNYKEIPVFSPTELQSGYSNAVVLVCSHSFNKEIYDALKKYGFSDKQIIQCPAQYPFFESPENFSKHRNGYEWAYDFYLDPVSKKTVLDRMELYLLDKGLVPNTTSDCYYEAGIVELNPQEVFVDGGAFTGDTTEDFICRTAGNYAHVYAFEPGDENHKKAFMRLNDYPNVELIKKGLWSKEKSLLFCQTENNLAGSHFSEDIAEKDCNNENSVFVTSLDSMFYQKKVDKLPTFIKLDIEGSEKEALIGATNIIQQAKPKLAVCAYHKIEDIYELPQIILNIRDDYNFVLRQHAQGCFDTVLYAY